MIAPGSRCPGSAINASISCPNSLSVFAYSRRETVNVATLDLAVFKSAWARPCAWNLSSSLIRQSPPPARLAPTRPTALIAFTALISLLVPVEAKAAGFRNECSARLCAVRSVEDVEVSDLRLKTQNQTPLDDSLE